MDSQMIRARGKLKDHSVIFTDEENKAQRRKGSWPLAHSWTAAELGLEPKIFSMNLFWFHKTECLKLL